MDTLNNLALLLSKEPSGREEAEMLYRWVLEVDPDDVNAPHDLCVCDL